MKPAIVVKTKKGKRYLQIKTTEDELIHIGPASVLENWRIAFAALQVEYESLFFIEKKVLYPIITAENLDIFEATNTQIDRQGKKWQTYLEKVNKKDDERENWANEYEKKYRVRVLRDPWCPKWFAMKKSRRANHDPAFKTAIEHHISFSH